MENGILSFKQRLFYFFPVLFCFALPYGTLFLSGLILVWSLSSFFVIKKDLLIQGFKNKYFLILSSFFLFTALSALFSDNKSEALFNVENKLSFIVFPYLLFCFKWPTQILKKCVVAFISGCFFACVLLIGRAFVYYFQGDAAYFFYNAFSFFIHPSSFTMYLIFAVCLSVIYYPSWFKEIKMYRYVTYLFNIIFIVTIFLNSSKIGIISSVFCFIILFLHKNKHRLNFKFVGVVVLTIIVLSFVLFQIFPTTFERLQAITEFNPELIDKASTESTGVRYLIWEQSLLIIKENFLWGVTVGDANDALLNAYQNNGMTGAFEHQLNAHNQFLQTFIGLGIIGFLLLSSFTFGALLKAILRKNIVLILFLIFIVLNFLVECMLQRSDGTLFFVFFYCFLNRRNIDEELA
ncbi:MAG: O-antigen ligase family protein [Sphingobacteriaceae bacterium]|nr:O-antigen ligase family protein [Sphingobacteriaceae bacterium]